MLVQKTRVVFIPGIYGLARLEENIRPIDFELTSDDVREINNTAAKTTISGAPYLAKLEIMIDL